MGTLFNQRVRESYEVDYEDVRHALRNAREISKGMHISIGDVIRMYRVLEMKRANNLKVWDGGAKDEQLAGFGEILNRLTESLASPPDNGVETLAEAISLLAACIEETQEQS